MHASHHYAVSQSLFPFRPSKPHPRPSFIASLHIGSVFPPPWGVRHLMYSFSPAVTRHLSSLMPLPPPLRPLPSPSSPHTLWHLLLATSRQRHICQCPLSLPANAYLTPYTRPLTHVLYTYLHQEQDRRWESSSARRWCSRYVVMAGLYTPMTINVSAICMCALLMHVSPNCTVILCAAEPGGPGAATTDQEADGIVAHGAF